MPIHDGCLPAEWCTLEVGCRDRPICERDPDCDDGLFCNGLERCDLKARICLSGTPDDLDDGVLCTVDQCDELDARLHHHPVSARCDDGQFCNGREQCDPVEGCRPGLAIDDGEDGTECTRETCNEQTDAIEHLPQHEICDDGLYCNGAEICDPIEGCIAGQRPEHAPEIDDGVDCTVSTCSEEAREILHVPSDAACDDGLFCNGAEICDVEAGCRPGISPDPDDGVDCTDDHCDELDDAVTHEPVHERCEDGQYCNGTEICDPEVGCIDGAPPILSDGIECTQDICDDSEDAVYHHPRSERCDDGLFCNGPEICDPARGCVAGGAPSQPDEVDCTEPVCDEANDRIEHAPAHDRCDDGLFCNGAEICDPIAGCQPGSPPDREDGIDCTDDRCDEGNDRIIHVPLDRRCSDQQFCNGAETCHALQDCQPGRPPERDDRVDCTEDICDEAADRIVHVPHNGRCDDGRLCNGAERCDVALDCRPGSPLTHDDGVACTEEICNEATGQIESVPSNARCDDDRYCNGAERCDAVRGCLPGEPPLTEDGLACSEGHCDEGNDAIIQTAFHHRCADEVFCNGDEICHLESGCIQGPRRDVNDGLDCTADRCDEENDVVIHTPDHEGCGDGNLCNGSETCDVERGCRPGIHRDDGDRCVGDSRSICLGGECRESVCGDGFVDEAGGEQCDDGNRNDTDPCSNACESQEGLEITVSGLYDIWPRVSYECTCVESYGCEVRIHVENIELIERGGALRVRGLYSDDPLRDLNGLFTEEDRRFQAQLDLLGIPGLGPVCNEHYILTGEFTTADIWGGTLEMLYDGDGCILVDPCVDQSFSIHGSRL